MNKIGNQN